MLIYVIKYKYIKKECSYLRGMKHNIGCIEIIIKPDDIKDYIMKRNIICIEHK